MQQMSVILHRQKTTMTVPSHIFNFIFAIPSHHSDITRNEFLVPMGVDLRSLYKDNPRMGNSMSSLQYLSVRPRMTTSTISQAIITFANYVNFY